jgi:hypothetical protein
MTVSILMLSVSGDVPESSALPTLGAAKWFYIPGQTLLAAGYVAQVVE